MHLFIISRGLNSKEIVLKDYLSVRELISLGFQLSWFGIPGCSWFPNFLQVYPAFWVRQLIDTFVPCILLIGLAWFFRKACRSWFQEIRPFEKQSWTSFYSWIGNTTYKEQFISKAFWVELCLPEVHENWKLFPQLLKILLKYFIQKSDDCQPDFDILIVNDDSFLIWFEIDV